MAPRPIRNRTEHEIALDELMRLARLLDAGKAGKAEVEAAEVLKLLVTDYERRRFGDLKTGGTPIEHLRFLIEESGMTPSDLGRLLGDRSLGYRVLNGERNLSKAHIRRLAEYFRIDPGYLF
ncbi:MAG: transcriptional regulator [bacterium]|nr:transcriptional regulator [bacterium]